MGANPKPQQIVVDFGRQCPITFADPDRPVLTDFFGMQGRVVDILFYQLEIFIGQLANIERKIIIAGPKRGAG